MAIGCRYRNASTNKLPGNDRASNVEGRQAAMVVEHEEEVGTPPVAEPPAEAEAEAEAESERAESDAESAASETGELAGGEPVLAMGCPTSIAGGDGVADGGGK